MHVRVVVHTAFTVTSHERIAREAGERLVKSGLDILQKVQAGVPGPYVLVEPDLPMAQGYADHVIEEARKLGVTVEAV